MQLGVFISQLLFSIGAGLYFAMAFVTPSQVGRRFFLYHGLPTLLLCLIANPNSASIFFVINGVAFCFLTGAKPPLAVITYVISAVYFWFSVRDVYYPYNYLASTLCLGFSMAAMWLGHWYLTQPKLSIDELKRVSLIMIAHIIARFAWGTYVAGGLLWGKNEMEIYNYLLGSTAGIFVLMRYCWGCLLPLILCYFVWGTVKIRSTQSATGLLYVMILAILTGETLSQYLATVHGIAF